MPSRKRKRRKDPGRNSRKRLSLPNMICPVFVPGVRTKRIPLLGPYRRDYEDIRLDFPPEFGLDYSRSARRVPDYWANYQEEGKSWPTGPNRTIEQIGPGSETE